MRCVAQSKWIAITVSGFFIIETIFINNKTISIKIKKINPFKVSAYMPKFSGSG